MTTSATLPPPIATDRLALRAHRAEDWPAATRLWSDPAIIRHIGGRPFTAEEVWARILRYAGLWALLGYGYWAIEEKASGHFIGEIGLADFKRDLDPSPGALPEMGFALAPAAQGKGYATEAAKAVLAWADARALTASSFCLIDRDNRPSQRVAEKCGYRRWQRARYRGAPTEIWRRSLAD